MTQFSLLGRVISVYSSECEVFCGGEVLSCSLRGKLRLEEDKVLAGDLVEIASKSSKYVVEKVLERKNFLIRPAVANVDQAVVVTAITEPPCDYLYIDRILAHLENQGIGAVICINKCDVEPSDRIQEFIQVYSSAGYPCVVTSALTGHGLKELAALLAGKVNVLAGASGTGKSKIISSLLGVGLLSGDLSRTRRGKHTTKWVKLYVAGDGGFLADTPGFSKLDVISCEPYEFSYFYPEMADLAPMCRFPRCLHITEDGCKVKEALEQGKISPRRYENYKTLLDEVIERAKRKYE